MTTEPPPKHSAATVGSTFMRQYYHLLAKDPPSLHRFYKDESVWCHGVGSAMQQPVSGQQAIHDEILRRGYAGAHVDLDIGSIDCQESLDNGVFVLVTGVMTLAQAPTTPRPFVQTFFLAVQPRGYFVLNDCLRFLELPMPTTGTTTVTKETAATGTTTEVEVATTVATTVEATSVTVTEVEKETETETVVVKEEVKKVVLPASPKKAASPVKPVKPVTASPVKPKSPVVKAAPPPVVEVSPVVVEEAASVPEPEPVAPTSPVKKPVSPVAAEKPAGKPPSPVKAVEKKPVEPAAPRTWAALFSGGGESTPAAAAPAQPVKAAPVSAKPAAVVPPATPVTAPTTASPKAKPAEAAAASVPHERKPRYHTLYIRDVPSQTKETDVRELFQTFGTIASVTVSGPRGFAFVDYHEETSMRAALAQEADFKLFDKVLHVEERKDKERGGFRADRGRGRGHGPRGGRMGDRRDRDDNKERREAPASGPNGRAPTAAGNGPRPGGDRRDKGGRRGGRDARAE